jgi:hypothetical protein
MEAAFHAMSLTGVSKIVALVGAGQPHAGFRAVVQYDLLGEAKTQIALEELRFALTSSARQLK